MEKNEPWNDQNAPISKNGVKWASIIIIGIVVLVIVVTIAIAISNK